MPSQTFHFRRFAGLALAALAVFVLATAPAYGATHLTLKSHQDGFEIQGQSQPAQDKTVEVWLDEGKIARDDGTSLVISDGKTLILADHAAKTYNVLELPIDLASLLPEQMKAQLDQMREVATISAEVTPGDETREVGDWTAQRYDVTLSNKMGLNVDQVVWASSEVKVDPSAYNSLTGSLASLQPGGGGWVSELGSIEGFPVLRETTMQIGPEAQVKTTEELVAVKTGDAPAGTFEPPADYSEEEFDFGGPAGS